MFHTRKNFVRSPKSGLVVESPVLDSAPVVTKVPFGNDFVEVTSFVEKPFIHPIPPEIKVSMFSLENTQLAPEIISTPYICDTRCESIYNNYRDMRSKVNNYVPEVAASPVVEVSKNVE